MEQEKVGQETKDILIWADKRSKAITVLATIALSAMGAMFIGLTVFAGLNLGSEMNRIANFRKEIKDDIADFRKELKNDINEFIGKSDKKPIIELFASIDSPLEDNTLPIVTRVKEKGKIVHAYFSIILKNKGEVTAKIEAVKFYLKKPIILKSKSTDEKEYDSEDYMEAEDLFTFLPAGASRGITYWMDFKQIGIPLTMHPVLVKVYYGEKKPVTYKFNIKFPEK